MTIHTDEVSRGSFNAFWWVRVWVLGEALCFQGWRGNENWRKWESAWVDNRGYWLGDQVGVPQKGWNIWVMWSENSVQMEESENWDILSDEWWVMKIEWWKLSDEKVLTKQGLNHFRQHLSLWPFLIEIGPHGSAKKKMLPFETWYGPTGSERSLIQCWQLTTTIFPYTFYCMNFCYYLFFIKNVTSSWSKAIITLERHTATLNSCDCPIHY